MPNIRVHLPDDGEEPSNSDDDLDELYHAAVAKPTVTFESAARYALPSQVIVAGQAYTVEVFVEGGEPTNRYGHLYGEELERDKVIRVSADYPHERRDTLLHEVLHAVDNATGTDAGETVVRAWAPVILEVLRANPELLAILLERDDTT